MRRVVLAATVVVVFAPVWAANGSVPTSGLRGLAVLDPAHPVCADDDPCTRPAPHVVLAFSQSGRVVARAKTQESGRYQVRLPAGIYKVAAPAYRIGSGVTPKSVRVVRSRIRRVNLTIDIGIQ
jgi:hypothetical protein